MAEKTFKQLSNDLEKKTAKLAKMTEDAKALKAEIADLKKLAAEKKKAEAAAKAAAKPKAAPKKSCCK